MAAFFLMGVSGSGKTTIGMRVADSLAIAFVEGDDYHPVENVQKMASGTPLTDADRMPWIDALMQSVNARPEPNVIVACSALTRAVRDRIAAQSRRGVWFVHLVADPALIAQRLAARGPHYMRPGMLPSQLAALQAPEGAIEIDTAGSLDEVCAKVQAEVRRRMD